MQSSGSVDAARHLWEEGTIPVDVEAIAASRGIKVLREDFEAEVSGIIILEAKTVIAVNRKHARTRQRFTIAHELGHFLLHPGRQRYFVDETLMFFRDTMSVEGVEPQEIEVNEFAAEVLMPAAAVRERLTRRPIDAFDDVAVKRLSSQFAVSPQAITIRLVRLGLLPNYPTESA